MSEIESAHGKLSPTDQAFGAPQFLMIVAGVLTAALLLIFFIASYRGDGPNDFSWEPLAHDIMKHSF